MSYRQHLTERLIKILFKLLRREHSRQELAREFRVNEKTISRDLDALTCEYQITSERRGREVFYRFVDGFKFHFPRISVEEVVTLLLAEKSISEIGLAGGTKLSGRADSLIEKLRNSLPSSIRKQIKETAQIYGSSAVAAKDFSRQTQIIDRLTSAAINRKRVKFEYHGLNKDTRDWRIFEPYSVYFDPDGSTLKLIGLATSDATIKVLSIDRISKLETLAEDFIRPADFDLKKYLEENCFNGIFGPPLTVRLKAKGVTARIFAERTFHPSQKVIERKRRRLDSPETITIEMRVAEGRGLERFILSWLPDVEVLSPTELREKIKGILRQGLENF